MCRLCVVISGHLRCGTLSQLEIVTDMISSWPVLLYTMTDKTVFVFLFKEMFALLREMGKNILTTTNTAIIFAMLGPEATETSNILMFSSPLELFDI